MWRVLNAGIAAAKRGRRARLLWSIAIVLVVVAGTAPALFDRPAYALYLAPGAWETGSAFHPSPEPQPGRLPAEIQRSPQGELWVNYTATAGLLPGELKSAYFELRARELLLPVVGFPNSRFAGIYVQEMGERRRYRVTRGAAHEHWQVFRMVLPRELVGKQVRVKAFSSDASTLIGAGTPFYRTNTAPMALQFSKPFTWALVAVLYASLIYLPAGFLVALRGRTTGMPALMTGFALGALLLLAAMFYVPYFWPAAGRWIARVFLSGSAVLAGVALFQRQKWLTARDAWVLILMLGCTALQILFLFSFNLASSQYAANYLFAPAAWSTDNQIPPTLAQLLAKGTLGSEWGFGQWTVSDRAPLLSALLYPAAVLFGDVDGMLAGTESMLLQACAIGLLHAWMIPASLLCRRVGLNAGQERAVLLLVFATPFLFFNTLYVWPKMLAAAFGLAQCLYLASGDRMRFGGKTAALAGIAAGLSIMSHTAAAIAVAGIFGAALLMRAWRNTLIAGAVTGAVVLPWIIWGKFFSPSNNPLARFWLTGEFDFTAAKGSLLQAVAARYRDMDLSGWLQTKAHALATLAGLEHQDARNALGQFADPFAQQLDSVRAFQFFFLLPAIGLLLVPFAFLLLRRNAFISVRYDPVVRLLLISGALTFAIQIGGMMAPHWLHHYPYLLPLTIHLLAIMAVIQSRSTGLRIVCAVNYLFFLALWIVAVVARTPVASAAGVAVVLLLFAAITAVVVRSLWIVPADRPQRSML